MIKQIRVLIVLLTGNQMCSAHTIVKAIYVNLYLYQFSYKKSTQCRSAGCVWTYLKISSIKSRSLKSSTSTTSWWLVNYLGIQNDFKVFSKPSVFRSPGSVCYLEGQNLHGNPPGLSASNGSPQVGSSQVRHQPLLKVYFRLYLGFLRPDQYSGFRSHHGSYFSIILIRSFLRVLLTCTSYYPLLVGQ